jgi:hypothetical protein
MLAVAIVITGPECQKPNCAPQWDTGLRVTTTARSCNRRYYLSYCPSS